MLELERQVAALTLENNRLRQGLTLEDPLLDIEELCDALDELEPERKKACAALCTGCPAECAVPECSVLSQCRDAACRGYSEVMHYTSVGDEEMVRRLISLGHEAHAARENGCTALHLAAKYNHPRLISVLLTAPGTAHVNATMADELKLFSEGLESWLGLTPLHFAAASGRTDSGLLLLDAGAVTQCEAFTADGLHSAVTPLHLAASADHLQMSIMLLERGAQLAALACCPSLGMASTTVFKIKTTAVQLAAGETRRALKSWGKACAQNQVSGIQCSWEYTRLWHWDITAHREFPIAFRRQVAGLAVCMGQSQSEVVQWIAEMMVQHNRELILGCTIPEEQDGEEQLLPLAGVKLEQLGCY